MEIGTSVERIGVLDFGAQYSQLIARRVRECHVYAEILPHDISPGHIKAMGLSGIILSGGPSSVYDAGVPTCDKTIFELGIPVLGICYGMQLMAHLLGGRVIGSAKREYGKTELEILSSGDLFKGLKGKVTTWMSHGDSVEDVPPGFLCIARTENTPIAAMAAPERKLYGVQFHPEVAHTPKGKQIISNFLYDVCGCKGLWTMGSFIEQSVEEIRKQVGSEKVICALSGGVDSSAVAVLVHKAVGDQLTCVFVNHGMLRKGEAEMVRSTFEEHFNIKLVYIEAEERFLNKLRGIVNPEQKRNIIGSEFVRVFEEEASKLGDIRFLAQGTIYPDVIESGTKSAAKIKTHHNVAGLPDDIKFELIEPIRYLFKDEVRDVCKELGLPDEITWRQPFPGPGLGVRVVGEVTKERLHILREADAIVLEEIQKAGLYRELWQSFAVLLPVQSVGVMGDQRTYAYPVVVRAVTSDDAMTADWAKLPTEVLERISRRIVNEVKGVNRVLYDISSKPPSTIEWE
ncbi:MAG: glutamine-hydrolyzing GMP synthase [Armatimonadetes bacterium]|nr:glutamine-hydrolyzing GMP synthase [Armatimonadota bacterium]